MLQDQCGPFTTHSPFTFTHPDQKIDQVDSENKDMGLSYMIQEKVIKNLQTKNQVLWGCQWDVPSPIPN